MAHKTGILGKVYSCPYIRGITIAAVDSNPDTYTDSNSGFLLAGFEAGDSITVSGFTTGGNNGVKTIATVDAGTITLVGGDTLTAESAGDDVVIVKNAPGTIRAGCAGWTLNQTCEIADVTNFHDSITATITADTIAFVDGGTNADTITDSGDGFVSAGFKDGDLIWISGSDDNDNISCIVSNVAEGVLTVPTGTLTGESAGDTVTIRAISLWKQKIATALDWTATLDKFWDTSGSGQPLFGVPHRYEFFIQYYASPSGGTPAIYWQGIGIANQISADMRILEVVKEPITITGCGSMTLVTKTSSW